MIPLLTPTAPQCPSGFVSPRGFSSHPLETRPPSFGAISVTWAPPLFSSTFTSLLPDVAADLVETHVTGIRQSSPARHGCLFWPLISYSWGRNDQRAPERRPGQSLVTPSGMEHTGKQAGCCFLSRIKLIILYAADRYEWAAEQNESQWSERNMLFYNRCTNQSHVSDEPNWTTGDLLQTMENVLELGMMWWHWSHNHNHTSGDTSLVPSGRDLKAKAPNHRFSSVKGEPLSHHLYRTGAVG